MNLFFDELQFWQITILTNNKFDESFSTHLGPWLTFQLVVHQHIIFILNSKIVHLIPFC